MQISSHGQGQLFVLIGSQYGHPSTTLTDSATTASPRSGRYSLAQRETLGIGCCRILSPGKGRQPCTSGGAWRHCINGEDFLFSDLCRIPTLITSYIACSVPNNGRT